MTSDDTRAKIIEAAGHVFADRGYQSATVREICDSAKVNVAAVNYHFGDKAQLYVEAVRSAHENRVREAPHSTHPQGTPAETRLRDFIATLVTRMVGIDEAPWQTRLMLREVLEPTRACRDLVEGYFRPQFGQLLQITDEMLPPETPLFRREQMAFSIVGQCLCYRVADRKGTVARQFARGRRREHENLHTRT